MNQYSQNHYYFLFLQVLRCFSSLRSPRFIAVIRRLRIGFPHSDSHGSIRMCQSPWIFAACHVLLRLQEPRHPPCTLINFSIYLISRMYIMSKISFRSLLSNYLSLLILVSLSIGVENNGFEPLTLCVQGRCSSQLS